MNVEDTGERRRLTDRVSMDRALELVCTLAMESALRRCSVDTTLEVEDAILRLRESFGVSKLR